MSNDRFCDASGDHLQDGKGSILGGIGLRDYPSVETVFPLQGKVTRGKQNIFKYYSLNLNLL